MKLFFTPRSPFVRKVRVALIETGVNQSVEEIPVDLENPPPELARHNPLGKVPTLVRDDGLALFDSPVICEYVDSLSQKVRLYPAGEARWIALHQLALADGILDALTTRRHEARRPAGERSDKAMAKQKLKSDRGLATLAGEVPRLGGAVTIGQIAAACCLGYLDFRFPEEPWRGNAPELARWFEEFSKRPSMVATMPPSGGH
jgi:glutathione S-transferase